MTEYQKKLAELSEEKERAERQQRQNIDDLNSSYESRARWKRDELNQVHDNISRDARYHSDDMRAADERRLNLMTQQTNEYQNTQADYNKRIRDTEKEANTKKEEEKNRQMKETNIIRDNQTAQLLEAEKTKSKINMISGKRIAEEKQHVSKQNEALMDDKKKMVEALNKDQKAQMQERIELEEEKNKTIIKTKQMALAFEERKAVLENVNMMAIASMNLAESAETTKSLAIQNLKTLKQKGMLLKTSVNGLVNSLRIPIQTKHLVLVKKALLISQTKMNGLSTTINSLKTCLESLHGDVERKKSAMEIENHLTDFRNELSGLEEYIKNKNSITLESLDKLEKCLDDVVKNVNLLATQIDQIPDIERGLHFIERNCQITQSIGKYDTAQAIETGSTFEQIENK